MHEESGSRRVGALLGATCTWPLPAHMQLHVRPAACGLCPEARRMCPGRVHTASAPLTCGQHVVSTWSARGQHVWSARGQHVVSMWSAHGQHVVSMWSACGQHVVSTWSARGQHAHDQFVAHYHSSTQQNQAPPPTLLARLLRLLLALPLLCLGSGGQHSLLHLGHLGGKKGGMGRSVVVSSGQQGPSWRRQCRSVVWALAPNMHTPGSGLSKLATAAPSWLTTTTSS
jgi:hypothetical protein